MKSKKLGTVLSIALLFVSISDIVVCSLGHCFITPLLLNIGIGVLGSAIVTLIISIGEYFVEKRLALEDYYQCALKILNSLRKIEYFSINEEIRLLIHYRIVRNYPDDEIEMISHTKEKAFNSLMNYYQNDDKVNSILMKTTDQQQIKAIFDVWADKAVENVNSVRNTYLKLNNVGLSELENAYGKIALFFANKSHWYIRKNKLCRTNIYNTIHNPLRTMINSIKKNLSYLSPDSNNKMLSLEIITDKISQLNEMLFKEEMLETDEYVWLHVSTPFCDRMDNELEKLRAQIYNVKPDTMEHYYIQSRIIQIKNKSVEE